MKIEFKTQSAVLNEALSLVSIVTPRPITPQGGGGYLFVVRGERCFVYSSDRLRTARADFPIEPIEGEGAFIWPAEYIGLLKLAGDGGITFTAVNDTDKWTASFRADSGNKSSRTTYDPKLMATCDKAVEEAKGEKVFPAGLLKEALNAAQGFAAATTATAEDHLKTVQVFDDSKPEWAKGNGTLFAASGVTACYFQCSAFEGNGLAIHGQHLPMVSSFLGQCQGDVTIRTGANMTFATDSKGRVLGWTHHDKTHAKYAYYSPDLDKVRLDIPISPMMSAIKYIQTALGTKNENDKAKAKFVYVAKEQAVYLKTTESNSETESFAVPVIPHDGFGDIDLTFFCNAHHLADLFSSSKGDRVTFRVAIQEKNEKRPKDMAAVSALMQPLINS